MSDMTEQPARQATRARRAADEFGELLGTAAYPVGARIPATRLIRDMCGVSDSTAYEAVRLLRKDGRLRVQQGMPSVVLALPDDPPPPATASNSSRSTGGHSTASRAPPT